MIIRVSIGFPGWISLQRSASRPYDDEDGKAGATKCAERHDQRSPAPEKERTWSFKHGGEFAMSSKVSPSLVGRLGGWLAAKSKFHQRKRRIRSAEKTEVQLMLEVAVLP